MKRFLVLSFIGLLSACGSEDSHGNSAECSSFYPCGGNLIGTWNLTNICISDMANPFATSCPSATFQGSADVTGSMEFRADGTYSGGGNITVSEDFTIPNSCLGSYTCASFQAALVQESEGTGAATCSASRSAAGCDCKYSVAQTSSAGGTYLISGTTVTTTKVDGTSSTRSFCVQGNTLLQQVSEDTMDITLVGVRQ